MRTARRLISPSGSAMEALPDSDCRPAEETSPAQADTGHGRLDRLQLPTPYDVGLLAVLGAIFVIALAPRLDTDLWWHIKVGGYIVQHGRVPNRDFLSFTFAGHPWTDHEWLSEIVMYALWRLAGLWGPVVLFALVITATFAFVYASMRRLNVYPFLALFILVAAAAASSVSWGPRIQMFSMLLTSVCIYLLTELRQSRNRRVLYAFPPLLLLWANLHGGFVLGLLLLGIAGAGEVVNATWGRGAPGDLHTARAIGAALLASALVTVLNPHGVRLLLYPLTFVLPNPFTNVIQESASPNFHSVNMMVFEALLLVLITAAYLGRRRIDWTAVLLIAAFTHLSLSQVRNVPLWCVAVSPFLALYLQEAVPGVRRLARSRRRPPRTVINAGLMGLVALLYLVEGTRFVSPNSIAVAETQEYPVAAVAYMANHKLPQDVLVSYNWSGYFIAQLGPRYRTFLDLRADTLFSAGILRAYLQAYTAAPSWQHVLSHYRVRDILVERSSPLAQVLAGSHDWHRVYADRQAVIYVRA